MTPAAKTNPRKLGPEPTIRNISAAATTTSTSLLTRIRSSGQDGGRPAPAEQRVDHLDRGQRGGLPGESRQATAFDLRSGLHGPPAVKSRLRLATARCRAAPGRAVNDHASIGSAVATHSAAIRITVGVAPI